MVVTQNSLAYAATELYRATFRVTDALDIRLFKTWVDEARAQLIKQRLDDSRYIDESIVQDLGYVEMEQVDSSSYNLITSGKYMLRSKEDIPLTINRKNNLGAFTRIGPADRLDVKYNFVSYDRALVSGNGRFNSNDVYAFLDGAKLCLISKTNLHKLIKYIHVKGVFANPEEAYNFRYGDGVWDGTQAYPVSSAMISDIHTLILDKKFKYVLQQVDDKLSNGSDDTTSTKVR